MLNSQITFCPLLLNRGMFLNVSFYHLTCYNSLKMQLNIKRFIADLQNL